MKVEFTVSFKYVPPEIPDGRVDNVALMNAIVDQGYITFKDSFAKWIADNHPAETIDVEEQKAWIDQIIREIYYD